RTCIRCGQCIKACVTNTLQPSGLADGLEGMFAPKHLMRLGGCGQSCNLCGQVCPTGAIRVSPHGEFRLAKGSYIELARERQMTFEPVGPTQDSFEYY
ncbi:MAG: 4Fe-4S dicluster domain-containing protein, partial [Candidatus Alcyoniella australis]|nr:4Fe-4S dicluster domain-containing protein [Candidatus Alcyoniella australis]